MKSLLAVLAVLAIASAAHAAPQPVTITVTPQTAEVSAVPVLAWSSPGATSCTASGGWSGTKATAGSETLPKVTKLGDTLYTLTCASPSGPVTLNWLPPTQNTDGTALTNLAGYRLYYGPGAGALNSSIVLTGAGATSTDQDIPVGPQVFAMTAVNSSMIESDKSNTVSKTIVADVGAGAAKLTITPPKIPMPPSNVTVH
jgi:hypothetical protein